MSGYGWDIRKVEGLRKVPTQNPFHTLNECMRRFR